MIDPKRTSPATKNGCKLRKMAVCDAAHRSSAAIRRTDRCRGECDVRVCSAPTVRRWTQPVRFVSYGALIGVFGDIFQQLLTRCSRCTPQQVRAPIRSKMPCAGLCPWKRARAVLRSRMSSITLLRPITSQFVRVAALSAHAVRRRISQCIWLQPGSWARNGGAAQNKAVRSLTSMYWLHLVSFSPLPPLPPIALHYTVHPDSEH